MFNGTKVLFVGLILSPDRLAYFVSIWASSMRAFGLASATMSVSSANWNAVSGSSRAAVESCTSLRRISCMVSATMLKRREERGSPCLRPFWWKN